jgi:peroxiredoxin
MSMPEQFPSTDFSTVGPQVGERFPDIMLPDQHGTLTDLHAVRGERRALIIFHRSARW